MCSTWNELFELCGLDENTKVTSDKKAALIEFLSKYNYSLKSCSDSRYKWRAVVEGTYYNRSGFGNSFEEASLNLLISLYPQLPPSEQQRVNEILQNEKLYFSFTIN